MGNKVRGRAIVREHAVQELPQRLWEWYQVCLRVRLFQRNSRKICLFPSLMSVRSDVSTITVTFV